MIFYEPLWSTKDSGIDDEGELKSALSVSLLLFIYSIINRLSLQLDATRQLSSVSHRP